MRCFICANDCKTFTTSLQISEEPKDERETDETDETDDNSATGDPGDGDLHLYRRRSGYAFVELAGANVIRVAANYLLAGDRIAGSLPNSVRRLWPWWRWASQFASANGG